MTRLGQHFPTGPKRAARPAPKQEDILARLRHWLLDQAPGQRLPTLRELHVHLGGTRATLHRAVEQLQRDGFVESFGRKGTFVAEFPPHLCTYGLVLSSDNIAHDATMRSR